MVLRQTGCTGERGRQSHAYTSPFDIAAKRWRQPDFEYDDGIVPEVPVTAKEGFHIFDLAPPFVPPSQIALPAHDPFGWPHGDRYTPLLKARTPLTSTRAIIPGFKLDRLHQALSMSEFRVMVKLALHPAVWDFREQYGIYNRQAYWRAEAKGERMRRSDLMTIDVIVTYVQPPDYKLKYHAISVKHGSYLPTDEQLRREERERAAMAERGWTWELIRGDAISMTEFGNLRLILNFAREQNLPSLYFGAQEFAPVVIRSSNRGSLDAVMQRVSRTMCIGLDEAYHRFAASVAYGFLQLDHNYELDTDLRLHLVRSGRHTRAAAKAGVAT